jgi:NADH-quinone oxidoreductase subunit N
MSHLMLLQHHAFAGILVLGALLVLGVDLLPGCDAGRVWRRMISARTGGGDPLPQPGAGRRGVSTGLSTWLSLATLALAFHYAPIDGGGGAAILACLVAGGMSLSLNQGRLRLGNQAEHAALALFALAGVSILCVADNFLIAFAALELASLSLYLLAGFDKSSPKSAEAGLKYFLYGGTAAAFLLFGLSLLYGLTGRMDFSGAGEMLTPEILRSPLYIVATGMVFAGLAYKAAAAPFHLWAPDTYQGAPTSSAALIASASKFGAFLLFARFLGNVVSIHSPAFFAFFALVAASLLVGNIGALAQENLRRLLAYSAIGHAGVLLIAALIQDGPQSLGAEPGLVYYLATYAFANIGVFGVIAALEQGGGCEKLGDLAGLWKRSPFLAICLSIHVLSLAGIPPFGGFFAKFWVFAQALRLAREGGPLEAVGAPLYGMVFLAIGMGVVALYYYLRILKAAFVAPDDGAVQEPLRTPPGIAVPVGLSAFAIVCMGLVLCH